MLYFSNMQYKHIICVLLTALLLIVDSGQLISAHTCLKVKKTSFSFTGSNSCCKKDNSTGGGLSFKKSACCETNAAYLKHSVPGSPIVQGSFKSDIKVFAVRNIITPFASISSYLSSSYTPVSGFPAVKVPLSLLQVFRC